MLTHNFSSAIEPGSAIPSRGEGLQWLRMIPARIDDSVESSAKRRIFELLAADPDTAGWTVLHSLGLARRPTGPYGEIDFVVVVPQEGILCLEVKGGRASCKGGIWRTIDRLGRVSELNKRSLSVLPRNSVSP